MAHYALLKGHTTAVVPMSVVDEYNQKDGLIPSDLITGLRCSGYRGVDARDIEIVVVQHEIRGNRLFYRIMGDENRAPE
jgi:hypothetical protein